MKMGVNKTTAVKLGCTCKLVWSCCLQSVTTALGYWCCAFPLHCCLTCAPAPPAAVRMSVSFMLSSSVLTDASKKNRSTCRQDSRQTSFDGN